MPAFRGRRRTLVVAAIAAVCLGLFVSEWAGAPRVHADAPVLEELTHARGALYLGTRFEGLPLRTVQPFLYSDCAPGKAHVVACTWVKVDHGLVTGSDPKQVARAQGKLTAVP